MIILLHVPAATPAGSAHPRLHRMPVEADRLSPRARAWAQARAASTGGTILLTSLRPAREMPEYAATLRSRYMEYAGDPDAPMIRAVHWGGLRVAVGADGQAWAERSAARIQAMTPLWRVYGPGGHLGGHYADDYTPSAETDARMTAEQIVHCWGPVRPYRTARGWLDAATRGEVPPPVGDSPAGPLWDPETVWLCQHPATAAA